MPLMNSGIVPREINTQKENKGLTEFTFLPEVRKRLEAAVTCSAYLALAAGGRGVGGGGGGKTQLLRRYVIRCEFVFTEDLDRKVGTEIDI